LKRCPECFRFDVEYDPVIGTERCLWKDCGWVNKEHKDLENENYDCNFSKFKKYLEVNRIAEV